jgi:hypothetical protein
VIVRHDLEAHAHSAGNDISSNVSHLFSLITLQEPLQGPPRKNVHAYRHIQLPMLHGDKSLQLCHGWPLHKVHHPVALGAQTANPHEVRVLHGVLLSDHCHIGSLCSVVCKKLAEWQVVHVLCTDDQDIISVWHALPGMTDMRQRMAESVCTPSVPLLGLWSLVAGERVQELPMALHRVLGIRVMDAFQQVVSVGLRQHMPAHTSTVAVQLIECVPFCVVSEALQM